MVDLAENWAEQYLETTDDHQHPSTGTSDAQEQRDLPWTSEYLSSDIPNESTTGELQWAKDYMEQNEHKLWYIVTQICILLINAFTHSRICRAPIQETFSEVLPTQPRQDKLVSSNFWNVFAVFIGSRYMSNGSQFQVEGSTTQNARHCVVEVVTQRTRRWSVLEEWKARRSDIMFGRGDPSCVCTHAHTLIRKFIGS